MLNDWLLKFAEWVGETSFSVDLHESFYMYDWIESTHVMTLMISLGMLIVIDLRMLGLVAGGRAGLEARGSGSTSRC